MIPTGTYKARAREWAFGLSQNGNEQIAVMFALVGGEHDGQTITWFGHFTDKTLERTLDSLRHMGWQSDNIAELDDLGTNEVEIVIDEEEYDGKVRSKVRWVNGPSRLALKDQMNRSQVEAFAARLRGKTVAHKQKNGAGTASRERAASAAFSPMPDTDDDIPF